MAEEDLTVGQKFSDFEQFDSFLESYMQRTKQILCIAYARTVEQHNKMRTKKLRAKLKYAYVNYRCQSGGKERHRGLGIRQVPR